RARDQRHLAHLGAERVGELDLLARLRDLHVTGQPAHVHAAPAAARRLRGIGRAAVGGRAGLLAITTAAAPTPAALPTSASAVAAPPAPRARTAPPPRPPPRGAPPAGRSCRNQPATGR